VSIVSVSAFLSSVLHQYHCPLTLPFYLVGESKESSESKSLHLDCEYGLEVARDAAGYAVVQDYLHVLLCLHLSLLLWPPQGALGASEGLDILFEQVAVALPVVKAEAELAAVVPLALESLVLESLVLESLVLASLVLESLVLESLVLESLVLESQVAAGTLRSA